MNVLPSLEQATYDKVFRRVIPLLFTCYIVAFLDRVNVGFAKLQMAGDLHFSDAVYGFGAGIFFIGYFLFEVPSNVILSYAVTFWMPTLIQELGADPKDFLTVGLLSMIPWGVAAVCIVLVGSHSDRTGERRWHAAGSLGVAVVGLLALALVGHAAAPSIIALTLVTAGTLSWVVTFWSLPTAFLSGSAAAAGIA